MEPDRIRLARRHEEHVTVTEERLGSVAVENRPGVRHRNHAEGDPGSEIRFDDAGDNVDRRALRGEDEVDSNRPCHLSQTLHGCFNLTRSPDHQIGELVHDHDDVRKPVLVVVR